MIKASGQNAFGQPLLILGLSGESITRIVADEPIWIKYREMYRMGLPAVEIVITYRKTEEEIINILQEKYPNIKKLENRS